MPLKVKAKAKGPAMERSELEKRIKELVISSLDLEDVAVADIGSDIPLFGDGLGLDSIDALELGMAIRKEFGVKFSQNPADNREIFRSVSTLADFIDGGAK